MKPFIFLSENYLKYTQDGNSAAIDIRNINGQVPYTTTIYFSDRYGNVVNRTFDTLILANTNIKNMTVEAYVNGAYTTAFSVSNNTQDTIIVKKENAVTTSSLRITIPDDTYNPATVTAEIGVYSFLCNLLALTDTTYKIEANEGNYRVVSGSFIHWADYKKWTAKVKMENLTQVQFNLLTAQAELGEMTVIPYTDLEADEIYDCAVGREYEYGLNRKTELFNLELEFNEL